MNPKYKAFHESTRRKEMKPCEMARWLNQMRGLGMDIKQISEATGINQQTVHGRLSLLRLTPEEQDQVDRGDMPYHKAIQLVVQRRKAESSRVPQTERRKPPSVEEFRELYEQREDLHEKVREFIATELLGIEYKTIKELKKDKF